MSFSFSICAQTLTLGSPVEGIIAVEKLSSPNSLKSLTSPIKFIGQTEEHYYFLMQERKQTSLQMYSKTDLSLIKETVLPAKKEVYYPTAQMKDNIISVYYLDKEVEVEKFYNLQLDNANEKNSEKSDGDFSTLLASQSSLMQNISPDGRYKGTVSGKKGKAVIEIKILDNATNNALWSEEIKWSYQENMFALEDYTIDNDGNFYILITKFKKEPKKDGTISPSDCSLDLIVCNRTGIIGQKTDMLDNSVAILSTKMSMNAQNDVYVMGLYQDIKDKEGVSKGIFSLFFDKNGKVLQETKIPFDDAFRGNVVKGSKNGKNGLKEFDIQDIIKHKDGSVTILMEYTSSSSTTFVQRRSYSSINSNNKTYVPFSSFSRGYFAYGSTHAYDIICVKIDKNYKHSVKVISKLQSAGEGGGALLSYGMLKKEDNIYLIFNDDDGNTAVTNPKCNSAHFSLLVENPALFWVKIAPDGTITKKRVLVDAKETMEFMPYLYFQTNEKEVLFFSANFLKKKYRLAKITIPF